MANEGRNMKEEEWTRVLFLVEKRRKKKKRSRGRDHVFNKWLP